MGIKVKDDFYLTAYEGVEDLSNFASKGDITFYREHLLEKTYSQRGFIEERVKPADRNFFEVGCGNGRLLIALHRESRSLYGIDISRSRIAFAQRWLKDLNLDKEIRCTVEDILHLDLTRLEKTFDVLICVTGTFAYFDAIAERGGGRAIEVFRALLKPDGLLVVELYPMPKELKYRLEYYTHELEDNELTYRTWDELPSEDPFRYYMSRISFNTVTRILNHEKIFVRRDGFLDEGKRHAVRVYDIDEILKMLDKNGFKVKEICGGWDGSDYQDGCSREIIICAKCQAKKKNPFEKIVTNSINRTTI